MPAVHGIAIGNMVDPVERALGVAIGLHAVCGFAKQCAREQVGYARQWGRWGLIQHVRLKGAMHKNGPAHDQPCRSLLQSGQYVMQHIGVVGGHDLGQRVVQMGGRAEFFAHKCAAKLAVMVANQEQAAPFALDLQHQAQNARAVWPVIYQVPQLNDKTVRGHSVAEGVYIPMHIAHNAESFSHCVLHVFVMQGIREHSIHTCSFLTFM